MQALIRSHLIQAQTRMKFQEDKHRSERSFAVGDWAYLKLQPFVQQSVVTRANRKLSFRFYGPFQVIARMGEVAYKLALPVTSLIHPVVHVSQLKKALAPSEQAQSALPVLRPIIDDQPQPVRIVERRFIRKGAKMVEQVCVQWSGADPAVLTWENPHELRHRFPSAQAWRQASFQGGQNVTPPSSASAQDSQPRRSRRERRPSSRFPMSVWTR